MTRWAVLTTAALCLILILAPTSRADDASLRGALKSVPANALGVVVIESLEELDSAALQIAQKVGQPLPSLQGLAMTVLQIRRGLDTSRPIVGFYLPTDNPQQRMMNFSVLVPSTDPQTMIESMGGLQKGEGVWQIQLQMAQRTVFGSPGDDHVMLGMSPKVVSEAVEGQGLAQTLTDSELYNLQGQTVGVMINVPGMLKQYGAEYQQIMMTAMQTSPEMAQSIEESDKQVRQMKSIALGLSVDNQGAALRFGYVAKAGTELAELVNSVDNTQGSLVSGLPKGVPWISIGSLNLGGEMFKDRTLKSFQSTLDEFKTKMVEEEGVNEQALNALIDQGKQIFMLTDGLTFAVDAPTQAEGGMLRVSAVVDTDSPDVLIKAVRSVFNTLPGLMPQQERFQRVLKSLELKPQQEQVDGIDVDLVTLTPKPERMTPKEMKAFRQFAGNDQVEIRMAPLGQKDRVVFQVLGNKNSISQLINAAKADQADRVKQPSVQTISQELPEARSAEAYFSVTDLMRLGQELADVQGGAAPFGEGPVPELKPIGVASTQTVNGTAADFYVPMDVIDYLWDLAQQRQRQRMQQNEPAEPEFDPNVPVF